MRNNAFLIVDKDEDMTSTHVDNLIKRKLKADKIGHLGTLDPFASGLLLLGINDACKLFPLIEEEKKTYVAKAVLGKKTDTLDRTGKVIFEEKIKPLSEEKISSVFSSFIGRSKQTPPKFSACHIDGKRAYQLARDNVDFKLKEKDIDVYKLTCLSFDESSITFKATVSKGCYIRVLAEDILAKLDNICYLKSLRREKIGDISLKNSVKVDDTIEKIFSSMISIDDMFPFIRCIDLQDDKVEKKVMNGNPLKREEINVDTQYIFFKKDGLIISLYQKKDALYHPFCKLNY